MRPPPARAAAARRRGCRGTGRAGSSRARRPTPPGLISKRSRTSVRAAQLTRAARSPARARKRHGVHPRHRARGRRARPGAASRPSSAASAVTASPSMSPRTTRQPSATSRRATAAPMPRPAPVTIATLTRAGWRRSRRRDRRARRAGRPAASRKNVCSLPARLDAREPVGPEALAEAAADHDGLDVEQRHGRADPDAERLDGPQDQLLGDLVPRLQRPQPDAAREPVAAALLHQLEEHRLALLGELARALLERAAARVRLDAPVEPAVAATAAGLRADVPDLAGRAAPDEVAAVDHDAAADTRAPEDAEERLEAAAGAEPALGLDGDVDVVADRHGAAELLRERRAERVRGRPSRRCSAT